jgi:hypothetical protein
MKTIYIKITVIIFFAYGIILGFSFYDDNPNNSKKARRLSDSKTEINKSAGHLSDNSGGVNQTYGSPYYIDNFDGPNDTNSLKARGYKVFYRGTGPQGINAIWYQGNAGMFPAFNGPPNGYVASNYQSVTGANNIDNWLILPAKNVASGDSIFFSSRSVLNAFYPDSIRLVYSPPGDSTPESFSWIELGRFKASTSGSWERRGFRAPAPGPNARFAIRYSVVNGGPNGANSDYIGIDALTIESPPLPSDVGTISIDSPANTFTIPVPTIAPKATFKNFGILNKTNIPVTFKITGPVNYTSIKLIPSLNSGASASVTADSDFTPIHGRYSFSVYTGLPGDGNRANDTLKTTFDVIDPNSGGGASYFFANNLTTNAPSHPDFIWYDTTGSIALISNGVNKKPNLFSGTLDDGYFRIGNILSPNKKIKFFGQYYDSLFISTNGIIGFTDAAQLTSYTPDTISNVRPAFYPLWTDLNYGSTLSSHLNNRLSYKLFGDSKILVTYDRAPAFQGDSTEYVSFQTVLEIVDITNPLNSRISVQYSDTTNGRTGKNFYDYYKTNGLNPNLVGLQSSIGNLQLYYRFANTIPTAYFGQLFSLSPVTVMFGPDPLKLSSLTDFSVAFYQLNLNYFGAVYYDSDWGTLELNVDGFNGTKFLNLSVAAPGVDSLWQIKNFPIQSLSNPGTIFKEYFSFDIGSSGINVPQIPYGISLTDLPLVNPLPINSSAPVSDLERYYDIQSCDSVPVADFTPPEAMPMVGYEVGDIANGLYVDRLMIKDEFFENQQSPLDAKVPTSISNSLKYLKKKFSLSERELPQDSTSIDKVMDMIGWDENNCSPDKWWEKKKEFMEAKNHKYAITTRYFPYPTPPLDDQKKKFMDNTIKPELDSNQDVEMIVEDKNGKTDVLCVRDISERDTVEDKNHYQSKKVVYRITTSDDSHDGFDEPGNKDLKTEPSVFDSYNTTNGDINKFSSGRLEGYKIKGFVVECPNKLKTRLKKPENRSGRGDNFIQQNINNDLVMENPQSKNFNHNYEQDISPYPLRFEWDTVHEAYSYWLEVSTDSLFAGVIIDTNHLPFAFFDTPPGALLPNTTYFWRVMVNDSVGPGTYDTIFSFATSLPTVLTLTAVIEGLYNPAANNMSISDTLTVYLRQSSNPYNIVDSAITVIDKNTLTGNAAFNNAPSGTYYIVLKHRNSITTWSKAGGITITSGVPFNYNFTSSSAQAFGNNLRQVDNSPVRFAIYSGDVNQDGTVDLSDVSLIDNDAYNFVTGNVVTDLNGDGFVDLSDLIIADNNSYNFVSAITPPAPVPPVNIGNVKNERNNSETKANERNKKSHIDKK